MTSTPTTPPELNARTEWKALRARHQHISRADNGARQHCYGNCGKQCWASSPAMPAIKWPFLRPAERSCATTILHRNLGALHLLRHALGPDSVLRLDRGEPGAGCKASDDQTASSIYGRGASAAPPACQCSQAERFWIADRLRLRPSESRDRRRAVHHRRQRCCWCWSSTKSSLPDC